MSPSCFVLALVARSHDNRNHWLRIR